MDNYEREVSVIESLESEYRLLGFNRAWDEVIREMKRRTIPEDAVTYLRCTLQIISAREKRRGMDKIEVIDLIHKFKREGMNEDDIQFKVGMNRETIRFILGLGERNGKEKSEE